MTKYDDLIYINSIQKSYLFIVNAWTDRVLCKEMFTNVVTLEAMARKEILNKVRFLKKMNSKTKTN